MGTGWLAGFAQGTVAQLDGKVYVLGGYPASRQTQPTSKVSTATAKTTANQMRTYKGKCNARLGEGVCGMESVLLFSKHVAHTTHCQDPFR